MQADLTLDETDRRIVAALRDDARATFAEVGQLVNLSAPAVKRRVDRLVANGTISAFTVTVDPTALGWGTEAYVEVFCNGKVSVAQWQARLRAIAEVAGAATVSGDADVLVHVLARDVRHLEQTIQRLRGLPQVTTTRTQFVLSRLVTREQ